MGGVGRPVAGGPVARGDRAAAERRARRHGRDPRPSLDRGPEAGPEPARVRDQRRDRGGHRRGARQRGSRAACPPCARQINDRPAAGFARDEPLAAPDLVVFPGSHDEILALLELCSRRRVAVVPFGGGTSVVGGLTPAVGAFAGSVALDLRRLERAGRVRRRVAPGHTRPGDPRAGGRGARQRARLHDRPLSAVVRVRDAWRVRGGPIERSGVRRLRSLRRAGATTPGRDAGRHAGARSRAQVGRGARPAPADPRIRGCVRGDHGIVGQRPPGAGRADLRGLADARLRSRDRGRRAPRPGRPGADRAAPLR